MCPVFKPSFRVHEAELVGERNGTRGVLVLKHGNEMDTSTNHRVTGIGTKATWAVSASENKRLLWRAAHFGFIPTLNGAIVIAYIFPASFRQIMLASGELTRWFAVVDKRRLRNAPAVVWRHTSCGDG